MKGSLSPVNKLMGLIPRDVPFFEKNKPRTAQIWPKKSKNQMVMSRGVQPQFCGKCPIILCNHDVGECGKPDDGLSFPGEDG